MEEASLSITQEETQMETLHVALTNLINEGLIAF